MLSERETMRDLLRYPITKLEVLNCLEDLLEEIQLEQGIGDMRPLLLQVAMEVIKRNSPPETPYMPAPENS